MRRGSFFNCNVRYNKIIHSNVGHIKGIQNIISIHYLLIFPVFPKYLVFNNLKRQVQDFKINTKRNQMTYVQCKNNPLKTNPTQYAVHMQEVWMIKFQMEAQWSGCLHRTLYSCVPGDSVFILDPSCTNCSVTLPILAWRSLYSSYSSQKSSL